MVCRKCGKCCRSGLWTAPGMTLEERMMIDEFVADNGIEVIDVRHGCRYLGKTNLCRIYPVRPKVCRDSRCRYGFDLEAVAIAEV